MAGIIETFAVSGQTIYAHARDYSGAIWNGAAFEAFNASNWTSYDIALTEDGTSGYYKVACPSFPAGKYSILFYAQAGASPSMSADAPLGTGSIRWDGTSEESGLLSNVTAGVWNAARASYTAAGSFGQALQVVRTGTAQAGASGTITLDSGASAVDDFYNNAIIQVVSGTGAGQSKIISDYVGSTKVATVNDNWATAPDNTSVFMVLPFGSVPGATAPTAAQVADAVWDEARSGHVSAGSFGAGVVAESLNAQAKADVNAEVDAALVDIDLDHLVKTTFASNPTIGTLFDKLMNKSAGQTFDQTTDSLEAIKDTGTGASTGQIAQAVWDYGLSGSLTANTAGERLKAIDDKLPTGTISDFDEGTNSVNLNASQSGVTIGTVNALGGTATGQINSEVVDALTVDVISELSSGAPTANPTIASAIMLLYMALRNKRVTSSSESKIYNNAGTAISKAAVSDNGTEFTKEQFGAP